MMRSQRVVGVSMLQIAHVSLAIMLLAGVECAGSEELDLATKTFSPENNRRYLGRNAGLIAEMDATAARLAVALAKQGLPKDETLKLAAIFSDDLLPRSKDLQSIRSAILTQLASEFDDSAVLRAAGDLQRAGRFTGPWSGGMADKTIAKARVDAMWTPLALEFIAALKQPTTASSDYVCGLIQGPVFSWPDSEYVPGIRVDPRCRSLLVEKILASLSGQAAPPSNMALARWTANVLQNAVLYRGVLSDEKMNDWCRAAVLVSDARKVVVFQLLSSLAGDQQSAVVNRSLAESLSAAVHAESDSKSDRRGVSEVGAPTLALLAAFSTDFRPTQELAERMGSRLATYVRDEQDQGKDDRLPPVDRVGYASQYWRAATNREAALDRIARQGKAINLKVTSPETLPHYGNLFFERWLNNEEPYQSLREKAGTSHGDYNLVLKYPAWEGSQAAMARLLTVTNTEAIMGSTVSRLSGLGPELRRFQQVPGVEAWLQLPAFQTLPAEVQARMHFYLGGDAARALAVLEAPAGKLPSEYAVDILGAALEVDPGAPLVEALRKRYADDGDLLVVWLIDTKRAVPAVEFPSQAYAKLVGRKNALSIIRILASLGRNAQPALGQLRSPLALSSVTGESSMKAALSLLGAIDRIEWESR